MGFLVWQDFMFACSVYELTPEFEENIRREFADNIKRIRHHASLGLWCGNNEMEMFVDEKSIRLNVVNETLKDRQIKVCWQLRDSKAAILRREEQVIEVPALTAVWMDKTELPDVDVFEQYVSFQAFEENCGTPIKEDGAGALNGDTKEVEILSGNADTLRLRSVYDIR